jgi:MFS family permease
LAGIGLGGMEVISFVYVSEISATNFRNNAHVALISIWAAAQILMGVIFKMVGYWRYMFGYGMGLPLVFCFILAWFWLDETPRYLVSKKRFEEAKEVLKKICIINSRPPFNFRLNGEITTDNERFFRVGVQNLDTTGVTAMTSKKEESGFSL